LGTARLCAGNTPIRTKSAVAPAGIVHEMVGVVPIPPIVTLFANGMLATAPGAGVVAVAVSVPLTAVSSQDPVKDEL
jgi:hypothetical protein